MNDQIDELLSNGVIFFSRRRPVEAERCFLEALTKEPGSKRATLLYSDFLKFTHRDKASLDELRAFESLVLEDEELEQRFARIGESRNEVLVYTGEHGNAAVFKRGKNKRVLELEREVTLAFREALGKKVAEPVDFVEHNGLHYFVTRNAGSRTLLEAALSDGLRFEQLDAALDLLLSIQSAGKTLIGNGAITADEPVARDNDYFTHRVLELFIGQLDQSAEKNALRQALLRSYPEINKRLASLPTTLYKDMGLPNIMIGKTGNLVAIDFENPRLLPIYLDIVNLLEFDGYFVTEQDKRTLLEKCRKRHKIPKGDFDRDFELAAFHRHLEIIGYRARSSRHGNVMAAAAQEYHRRMAIGHLEHILKNETFDATTNEGLASLLEQLKGLKMFDSKTAESIDSILERELSELKTTAISSFFRPTKTKIATGLAAAALLAASAFWYLNYAAREVPRTGQAFFEITDTERYEKRPMYETAVVDEKGVRRNSKGEPVSPEPRLVDVKLTDLKRAVYVISFSDNSVLKLEEDASGSADWSPTKNRLLVADDTGIRIKDLENNEERTLVSIGNPLTKSYSEAVWSPDGLKIAATKELFNVDKSGVFLIDAKGAGELALAKGVIPSKLVWSDDSNYIAFLGHLRDLTASYIVHNVYTVSKTGEFYKGPVAGNETPAWSNDSKKIAFEGDGGGLYVANRDFSSLEKILEENQYIARMVWGPGDEWIYFVSIGTPDNSDIALKRIKSDGSQLEALTQSGSSFGISPDSKTIYYIDNGEIWSMDLNGMGKAKLTSTPEKELAYEFSPDGRIFAISELNGIENVYLIDKQGRSTPLTFNNNPETSYAFVS